MDRDLLECEIEDPVCRYAKRRGFYVRKFTSPSHRSVPDRMLIAPSGKVFFIEFKRAGKTPTGAQQREIQRLADWCQSVYVIDNIASGKALVDAFTSASVSVGDRQPPAG